MSLKYVPVSKRDRDALFELHKLALGPYVEQLFGWDEQQQRHRFAQTFNTKGYQWLVVDDRRVGSISLQIKPCCVYLARLEIYPDCQRQGYGSSAIKAVIAQAKARSLPVELQVFKINPAIELYQRLGFRPVDGSDFHIHLRRSTETDQPST